MSHDGNANLIISLVLMFVVMLLTSVSVAMMRTKNNLTKSDLVILDKEYNDKKKLLTAMEIDLATNLSPVVIERTSNKLLPHMRPTQPLQIMNLQEVHP